MAMLASLCVCWWKWMDSCIILHIWEDVVQKGRIWCKRTVSCSLEMEKMRENNIKIMFMEENVWNSLRNQEECGNSMEMMECDWFSQEQERIQSIQNKQVLFSFVCDSKHNSIHSVFSFLFFSFLFFSSLFHSAFFACLVILCFCVKDYRRK